MREKNSRNWSAEKAMACLQPMERIRGGQRLTGKILDAVESGGRGECEIFVLKPAFLLLLAAVNAAVIGYVVLGGKDGGNKQTADLLAREYEMEQEYTDVFAMAAGGGGEQ